ncbi:unnamed protein product [Sympodiomycopsis kandeliae]
MRETRGSRQRQASTSVGTSKSAGQPDSHSVAETKGRGRGRPSKAEVKSESSHKVKRENSDEGENGLKQTDQNGSTPKKRVKTEDHDSATTPIRVKGTNGRSSSSVKKEESKPDVSETKPSPGKTLAERKLNQHRSSANKTPYPRWPLPTAEESEKVAWLLGRHHGYTPESEGGRGLPAFQPPKGEDKWGGCGDVKDVLEATIRTILSCNTSGVNSARAHQGLTKTFGARNWEKIATASHKEVEESIKMGGLANTKSKNIQNLLKETKSRFGSYSLQFLYDKPDSEVLETLISFSGIGPKVASCVLAFCLGRQSMAIDTHVFRIACNLNWVPPTKATRDSTYYHLNVTVPPEFRYPLHVLLIQHGKSCPNCKAKGNSRSSPRKKSKVKKEEDEDEDASDSSQDESHLKPCPLKANGLLSRKNIKLLPEPDAAE